MKKKTAAAIIVLLLIAGGLITVVNKKRSLLNLPAPQIPAPAVQVVPIEKGSLNITAHYMGSIEPLIKSDLSARVSGNILSIAKREGDSARQGEVLAIIDDRELVDKISAVNAELQAASQRFAGAKSVYETQKAVYERDVILHKAGAISQEALERSKAVFDGAKAAMDAYEEGVKGLTMSLSIAKTQAGYARITAPFNGVVTKRWAEPGDMAVPGKPIISMENVSSYKVTVQIPQEELSVIKLGTPATLTSDGQSITAKISRIYPSLNKNLLGTVEIALKSSPFNLPSYSTVGVDISKGRAEGFIVPEQALVKTSKGAFVYLIKDNVVHIKPVKFLGSGGGKSAVSGDLSEGGFVAAAQENKLLTLTEGSKVKAISVADIAGGKK